MARHGTAGAFLPLTHVKSPLKSLLWLKSNVFLYWQLLIILFADDRAKKYGITPLSASGKEKYISDAADFGAAARHGSGFHTQQIIVHFNDHR